MREFTFIRRTGRIAAGRSLEQVMRAAESRLITGRGPWAVKVNDKDAGRFKHKPAVLQEFRRALEGGDVGDVYRIRNDRRSIFQARETRPAVRIIDTNGNANADKCWSYVKDEFPKVTFLGAYVCKDIAGTSTPSQHSYGNAVDFGAATMSQLHVIANWILVHRVELDIQTIIVDQQIWTPSEGWHTYTGQRHYHVHADFQPSLSGACGVKG